MGHCGARMMGVVLVLVSPLLAVGCSNFLPSVLQNSSKSGQAGAGSINTPEGEEAPTVLVAGVNLTGECVMLSAAGSSPDTRSLECSISSSSETREVVASSVTLTLPSLQQTLIASAQHGEKSKRNQKAMVLGESRPIFFHFEVPTSIVPKIMSEPVLFKLGSLEFEDGSKHPVAFNLIVRRRTPPPECNKPGAEPKSVELKFSASERDVPTEVPPSIAELLGPSVALFQPVYATTKVDLKLDRSSELADLKEKKFRICGLALNGFEDEDEKDSDTGGGSLLPALKLKGFSLRSEAQRHVVSFGNTLLYSSVNSAFGATESLGVFRIGIIPGFDEFMSSLKSISALESSGEAWCAMGYNNCLSKTEDALVFRFGEYVNEVLAAEITDGIKSEKLDDKFKIWVFDKYPVSQLGGSAAQPFTLSNVPEQITASVSMKMTYVVIKNNNK